MDYILGKLERNFKLIFAGLIGISVFLQFETALIIVLVALLHSFSKDIGMYFKNQYRNIDSYAVDFYYDYKFVLTVSLILNAVVFQFVASLAFISFILSVSFLKDIFSVFSGENKDPKLEKTINDTIIFFLFLFYFLLCLVSIYFEIN